MSVSTGAKRTGVHLATPEAREARDRANIEATAQRRAWRKAAVTVDKYLVYRIDEYNVVVQKVGASEGDYAGYYPDIVSALLAVLIRLAEPKQSGTAQQVIEAINRAHAAIVAAVQKASEHDGE